MLVLNAGFPGIEKRAAFEHHFVDRHRMKLGAGMRTITLPVALALLTTFGTTSAFADLRKAEVVHKSGSWKVLRLKDSMTDKVSCVGIYKDEYRIQLSPGALYLDYRGKGGVDAYRVRIDDGKAGELRLATPTEKRISSVILSGEVQQLVKAKRLRVSGISILRSSIEEDLSLDGISEAYAQIMANPKCRG